MVSASIEGIEMPEAKEITVQTYESRYHDLGFYASQIDIPVEKVWDDSNDQDGKRPLDVTVTLYADGEKTEKTLTLSAGNDWKGGFTGLPGAQNGKKISYTVKETPVNDYTTEITGSASTGFTITNTHTPERITLSGAKRWDDADDRDGKRPDSVIIRLYADGSQAEAVTVTAEDGWTWKFENLPKYTNGREIRYTITEDAVPGYQSEISGMDVTNRYTPGKINIQVTKNWQDKDDADGIRPDSITVKLYADGKDTGKELVLDQKNNWTGSFDDLDEYADGVKIVYTIAEAEVDGYETAISGSAETGFVIGNSRRFCPSRRMAVSSSSIAIERLATLFVTRYSLLVYPIKEKESMSPCLARIEKKPSASVVVPRVVPCTTTVTPTSGTGGSFVSTTTPRMSNNSSSCSAANAEGGGNSVSPASRQNRLKRTDRKTDLSGEFITGLISSMIHCFKIHINLCRK